MSLAPSPDPTLVRLLSRLEQLSVLAGSGGKYQPALDGLGLDMPREDRAARYSRAVLVDHLADCLHYGVHPLTGADRARHVLEIMLAAKTAALEGRTVELTTSFVLA